MTSPGRALLAMLIGLAAFRCIAADAVDTRLSPQQAREDVLLAIAVAEAALPDIHWHQTPQAWEAAKARALSDASRASGAMDVHVAVARLMGHVGEGHLDVFPGDAARERQRATARLLPLDLHWSTEGLFVSGTHGDAGIVPAGSRIVTINGESVAALRAELVSLSSRDGRIETGAMRECAGSCYAVLRQRVRGDEAGFDLHYVTPAGRQAHARVAPHPMRERPPAAPRERRVATLEWLAPGVAHLEVSTFSNRVYRDAGTTFGEVIQRLFEELRQGGAERLILDLRGNGGGSEPNEAVLFSYLVAAPLRRYRSVEARGRHLAVAAPSGEVLEYEVFDDEEMRLQQPLADGRLSRRNLPPEGLMSHWRPSSPVYTGRLVVLIGGRTFSGGAELASMLHHVRRGLFVGEETGGTYEGNTSGYGWDVVLPHSGTRLGMPVLRFRFDWDADTPGRGVLPDCDVPPLVAETGQRRDRAWRVARRLLERTDDATLRCTDPGPATSPAQA